MTEVRADLRPLHGLYAWRLVGGRRDARPDWIHDTQGTMHRSGAKLRDLIHGRRRCIPRGKWKVKTCPRLSRGRNFSRQAGCTAWNCFRNSSGLMMYANPSLVPPEPVITTVPYPSKRPRIP